MQGKEPTLTNPYATIIITGINKFYNTGPRTDGFKIYLKLNNVGSEKSEAELINSK